MSDYPCVTEAMEIAYEETALLRKVMAAKISLPDVVPEFAAYFQIPGNGCWGSLHCVLDDLNNQDADVERAIRWAIERNDLGGERLGRILLRMSRTQRGKLDRLVQNYIKRPSDKTT